MKDALEIIRKTRAGFIGMTKNLSIEQMNLVPEGFNNNIIWNFGHIVVVQQGLCYGLAGLPQNVDKSLVIKYKKGSIPDTFISAEEFETLKALSVSLIDTFEEDIAKGIFPKAYSPFMTLLGVEIDSLEKAITFNAYHEGLHYGYAMSLKRAVKLVDSL
jgi:DinB superfamily